MCVENHVLTFSLFGYSKNMEKEKRASIEKKDSFTIIFSPQNRGEKVGINKNTSQLFLTFLRC